jgi:hypothetical protein
LSLFRGLAEARAVSDLEMASFQCFGSPCAPLTFFLKIVDLQTSQGLARWIWPNFDSSELSFPSRYFILMLWIIRRSTRGQGQYLSIGHPSRAAKALTSRSHALRCWTRIEAFPIERTPSAQDARPPRRAWERGIDSVFHVQPVEHGPAISRSPGARRVTKWGWCSGRRESRTRRRATERSSAGEHQNSRADAPIGDRTPKNRVCRSARPEQSGKARGGVCEQRLRGRRHDRGEGAFLWWTTTATRRKASPCYLSQARADFAVPAGPLLGRASCASRNRITSLRSQNGAMA